MPPNIPINWINNYRTKLRKYFEIEEQDYNDGSRLDFRRSLVSSGEERGLLSRQAAGDRAYDGSRSRLSKFDLMAR